VAASRLNAAGVAQADGFSLNVSNFNPTASEVAYGKAVAEGGRKNADTVKAQMLKGDYVIFKGPLKDNTGKTVIAGGTALKQTEPVLEQMNYLTEGVIGKV